MTSTTLSAERSKPVMRETYKTWAKEPAKNVAESERWLSLAGGAALAIYGLNQGSLPGLAAAAVGGALAYRGLTGHCALYETMGVNTAEKHGPATSVPAGHGVKVEQAMTINRSRDELYHFWHDFSNLPFFMRHLKSVSCSGKRSHWVARAPLGMSVEWEAEIINERPGELIAWRSLEGSEVDTAGSVHFKSVPNRRETEIHITLKYDPPAGKVGATLASWFGEAPEQQIREDLCRFKQLVEAGEVPTTAGQPSCRRS